MWIQTEVLGVTETNSGLTLDKGQDAIRSAIASRGGCFCSIHHANWVVTLRSPEDQEISGETLGKGLAWCLVSLIARGPQVTGA